MKYPAFFKESWDQNKCDRQEQNQRGAYVDEACRINTPIHCVEFIDEDGERGMIQYAVIGDKEKNNDDQFFPF